MFIPLEEYPDLPDDCEFLTDEQLAAELHIAPKTLKRRRREGTAPPYIRTAKGGTPLNPLPWVRFYQRKLAFTSTAEESARWEAG